MKTIDVATIRRVLRHEKKRLRDCRAKDFESNRARSSAASEDAISRVLMLEELLEGDAIALANEREGNTGREGGAASSNQALDL